MRLWRASKGKSRGESEGKDDRRVINLGNCGSFGTQRHLCESLYWTAHVDKLAANFATGQVTSYVPQAAGVSSDLRAALALPGSARQRSEIRRDLSCPQQNLSHVAYLPLIDCLSPICRATQGTIETCNCAHSQPQFTRNPPRQSAPLVPRVPPRRN